MARTSVVDSATAQFFINLVDNDFLNHGQRDFGYAVFGRVVGGMDVVDAIAKVRTGRNGAYQDVPVEPVVIESIKRAPDAGRPPASRRAASARGLGGAGRAVAEADPAGVGLAARGARRDQHAGLEAVLEEALEPALVEAPRDVDEQEHRALGRRERRALRAASSPAAR